MPLRYYGANATLSTISTSSFSHSSTITTLDKANKTMKEDNKTSITAQSSPTVEKRVTSSNVNKAPVSKLSLLAIALAIGLGGFVFYHGHKQVENQKKTIAHLQTELNNLKQTTKDSIIHDIQNNIIEAVNKQNQKIKTFEQSVEDQLNEQQKSQQQLSNKINDVSKISEQNIHNINERLTSMSATNYSVWLISQANYLVHLAGRKIWNEHDYATARLLLKNADVSLAQANDPSLIPARQAINEDINSLSKVSLIDYDGIIMQLVGLSESLNELPLVGNYKQINLGMTQHDGTVTPTQTAPSDTDITCAQNINSESDLDKQGITSSISDWSSNFLTSTKAFLAKFFTIEKMDEKDNNFKTCLSKAGLDEKQMLRCQILKDPLSLEQSLYLRENIRFRLLIAAQAVPRHQELIYQRALSDAALWVNTYFDDKAPSVKTFLDDLNTLLNQSISDQSVPNQLESTNELEKLMRTRVHSMLAK